MPRELSTTDLKRLWDQGDEPYVLDVREAWELDIARLPNIVHIPMSQVPDRLAELPRNREIIVMCRSGGRSLQVGAFLERQGFAGVANLTGGILAWHDEVDNSIPRY